MALRTVRDAVLFPGRIKNSPIRVKTVKTQNLLLGDEGIASVHASTVLPLENGEVLAAWFGGTQEKNPDVRIWVSRRDSFGTWTRAERVCAVENVAHWNPVLDRRLDGSVRLYFKVGKEIKEWKTYYCDSFDSGRSFSIPKALVPDDERDGRGPVKNKCIRTREGLLLAGASSEIEGYRVFIDCSRDDGDTWENSGFVDTRTPKGKHVGSIQPTLWQDDAGAVHFLCRSRNDGWIMRSDSEDGGITWCAAYRTKVRNNDSGIDCVKDDKGRVWLLCNPMGGTYYRSPLRLFVSEDNAKSFSPVLDFERERRGEFSYPAITCVGNKLYCTYTNKRTNITFAEVELDCD